MHRKFFLWMITLSLVSPVVATQAPKSRIYDQKNRAGILEKQKEAQDEVTQKRVEERSKGRAIREVGQTISTTSDEIDNFLFRNAPLSIKQHPAMTFVTVINTVVGGVGLGIQAYGRRKEILQPIISSNEQILEAAMRSFEKIQALSKSLTDLIGNKTIQEAYQENQSLEADTGQRLLNLFAPSNFINTFNNFTDDLYITDNKAARWEKIKQAAKDLREEEERYDDFIALLQIKALEQMLMELHKIKNRNPSKLSIGKDDKKYEFYQAGYIKTLEDSIDVFDKAIEITGEKIQIVEKKITELNVSSVKGNILSQIKKKIDKDKQIKDAKSLSNTPGTQKFKALLDARTWDVSILQGVLESLKSEKDNYIKKRDATEIEKKRYEGIQVNPQEIAAEETKIKKKIENVKGRKMATLKIEDLRDEVKSLKSQIEQLKKDNSLK